jgi:hypothetical protein
MKIALKITTTLLIMLGLFVFLVLPDCVHHGAGAP